jgi:hypothetical protein
VREGKLLCMIHFVPESSAYEYLVGSPKGKAVSFVQNLLFSRSVAQTSSCAAVNWDPASR